jgi:hypothetical protein
VKEIELHEDDPRAMVALLRHIYDLPIRPEGGEMWPWDLNSHAELYMTAGKYLMEGLKSEVCRSMTNCHHSHGTIRDITDFLKGLRKIMICTSSKDHARKVLVNTCILNLKLLQEQSGFLSLLREFADLGADILEHRDLGRELSGFFVCCDPCSDVSPSCSKCDVMFEIGISWDQRSLEEWWCGNCKAPVVPWCMNCDTYLIWIQRR